MHNSKNGVKAIKNALEKGEVLSTRYIIAKKNLFHFQSILRWPKSCGDSALESPSGVSDSTSTVVLRYSSFTNSANGIAIPVLMGKM